MREEEFDSLREVAFGVHETLRKDGHMLIRGMCTLGRIVPGRMFTSLWDSHSTVSGGHFGVIFDPIGSLHIKVITITMFGKQMEWVQAGDMCILKVDGEGIDGIGGGSVLSIPKVDKST
jgi:hypothetical protein